MVWRKFYFYLCKLLKIEFRIFCTNFCFYSSQYVNKMRFYASELVGFKFFVNPNHEYMANATVTPNPLNSI